LIKVTLNILHFLSDFLETFPHIGGIQPREDGSVTASTKSGTQHYTSLSDYISKMIEKKLFIKPISMQLDTKDHYGVMTYSTLPV
jgi:hypothetical protein